jgi:hypothetical protein
MGDSEACATVAGACVHGASHNAAGHWHWNEDVLDIDISLEAVKRKAGEYEVGSEM